MNRSLSLRAAAVFAILTLGFVAKASAAAEQSIYGDCKNGFGILRVDRDQGDGFGQPTYFVGTFKKGRLEGQGYQIFFGADKGRDEVKLLQIAMAGKLERMKTLNGELIYVGEFVHGVRQGKGALRRDRSGEGPYSHVLQEIFQGNFVNGQLSGAGIMQRSTNEYEALGSTVTFSGEYERGRLIKGVATVERGGETGFIEGPAVDAPRLNGWFTLNFVRTRDALRIEPEPFRMMFVDGNRVEESRSRTTTLRHARVQLPDRTYEGEVDEAGGPAGFGRLWWSEYGNSYSYEGFVANGRPHGYGCLRWAWTFPSTMGGQWVNGEMVHGVVVHEQSSTTVAIWGGYDPETRTPGRFSRQSNGGLIDGRATEVSYNMKDGAHSQYKRTEGSYRNGRKIGVFVTTTAAGSTTRETYTDGQLTGFTGQKDFHDLHVGDVVCVDGLISPVEKIAAFMVTLLDGRVVTFYGGQKVEVSDTPLSRFYETCPRCRGMTFIEEMYQPPEQQVEVTTYERNVIVGDFTIMTTYIPRTSIVTRTPPAYPRTTYCPDCDGRGRLGSTTQLHKGE